MLFGVCNCLPLSPDVSRRDLICGGGAGFVSALVGALVGSGRTARAQPIGARVPEVDRLAITFVTDNQIIKFIPTEKRDGLTIERRPAGNVRPDAPPRADLVGEWGLSMHAQSQRGNEVRNILIDFGYNSAKYAYPAGNCRVWITLSRAENDMVVISVRDKGVGLPPTFDINSGKRLGMRLIDAFSQQLQGNLQVLRKEPGSEFILTFPLGSRS